MFNKKEKNWKVEIRSDCKICGKKLPNANYRTFCSEKCRIKSYNIKRTEFGYGRDYQRKKRDKIAYMENPDKCKCLICGKYYIQVCSHVVAMHKMTAREYREEFDLEVSREVVPGWYREKKGTTAKNNGTCLNLKKGAKFRFKKGDKTLGKYKRSHITEARLKKLNTFKKKKYE